jgi:ribosome-associated heat shock protein Hsp15
MERIRLDIWLDVSCLFKTRSEAQKACKGGKIDVNRQRARAHREIKFGDEIRISRPQGRRQVVIVRGLAERHLPKAEARELYEDVTPPPSAEEQAFQEILRASRQSFGGRPAAAPEKRDRRLLRRLKGRDE